MAKLEQLIKILACPKCKGDVKLEKAKKRIACVNCRLAYPLLEGDIPDMLVEDAKPL